MEQDIREVCKEMNLSSRTLRFYEEEGLIKSVRNQENTARKYTEEEVEKIRKIKILRSLSFSVKDIREIMQSDLDIMSAVLKRINVITAEVVKWEKKLCYIETALTRIQDGKDIFDPAFFENNQIKEKRIVIAKKIIEMFNQRQVDHMTDYFAKHLRKYVDDKMLLTFWEERTAACGGFEEIEAIEAVGDDLYLTLKMKQTSIIFVFSFFDEYLCGFNFGSIGYEIGGAEHGEQESNIYEE